MSAIVRTEVLRALDQAEARGGKRVRVIVGLRPRSDRQVLKRALRQLGVEPALRESESFLVVRLSREEVLRVSQLSEHVSAIWLDRPVSATKD